MLGISDDRLKVLPTTKADSFALHPQTLINAIKEDQQHGMACVHGTWSLSVRLGRIAVFANTDFMPFFVCLTVGTTSSAVIDPLDAITSSFNVSAILVCFAAFLACPCLDISVIRAVHQFAADRIWVHIDAAWGGAFCVCPENQHVLKGMAQRAVVSTVPNRLTVLDLRCVCVCVYRH